MRGRNLVAIHRSAVCPHLGQESGDMSTTLLLVQDVEQTNPNLGPQPYQKPHLLSTTHILNGNVALFRASDFARPDGL